jgi:D-alanyl-D-alanine carboxypeptidase (penicillin-binding protein 5/6)
MKSPLLTNKLEVKIFSVLGAVLIGLIVMSFIVINKVERGNISSPAKVATSPYDNLNLVAKSAYVFDIRTKKVLYSKNSDERVPLASLTKLMTALVARSNESEHATVTISNLAIQTEGDSGLRVGERWALNDLLEFSLTSSSNDGMAAVALAFGSEKRFVTLMNTKADQIGMKNTYYLNETGLDESTQKGGAYGTAKDTATLFAYILENYPDLLPATTKPSISVKSLDNITHTANNTDLITQDIPGLKGSKTGYTDLAGGNLVIAFDPELGRPIVITVLGSTAGERFTDVEKLVDATLVDIQSSKN